MLQALDFTLNNIFGAFLHYFETLLLTSERPLKEAIWEEDLGVPLLSERLAARIYQDFK